VQIGLDWFVGIGYFLSMGNAKTNRGRIKMNDSDITINNSNRLKKYIGEQVLIMSALEDIEAYMKAGMSLRYSYITWSNRAHAGLAVHQVVCCHLGFDWKEPGRRVAR
tara:strand:- start:357 stop:680 length:324 start_codon:yes stop_codon:yes gene_type:complete